MNVPNVPCGVERDFKEFQKKVISFKKFLMYRVELKEIFSNMEFSPTQGQFLMYRVELKDRF